MPLRGRPGQSVPRRAGLDAVASPGSAPSLVGVSARAILAALVAGSTDAAALAELAKGELRRKRAELERALSGRLRDHHRRLLAVHLARMDFLEEATAALDEQIAAGLAADEEALARLETIPGVGRRTAEVIAAEVGPTMEQFPSARHLAAWAGMAPGGNESGGKRRSGRARQGSKWLRRALVEAAHAAVRTKKRGETGFADRYRRVVVRRGPRRAAVAVGHSILVTASYLLTRGTAYRELDRAAVDDRRRARARQRALDQVRALGYAVALTPRPAA